jgi:serine/threonine-protein kinase
VAQPAADLAETAIRPIPRIQPAPGRPSPPTPPDAAKQPAAAKEPAGHEQVSAYRPSTEISQPTPVSGRIAGYLLEEQIGQGGMAIVYRATDERLGRHVALKLLAPAIAQDGGFRQRFIRESRAAAAVDHPNIIPIYEAGEKDGALFIAMRYVQGGDVRSLLEHQGPLPAGQTWSIISQVASALDAAHVHGLVHRDVKPANMLLDGSPGSAGRCWTPAGRGEHVYLSDFGISKQPLSSAITMTGQFVGTLDYIAPEQISGRDIDGRADLYSLACATFELLSGTPPFRQEHQLALVKAHLSDDPPPVTSRQPGLPAAVDQVLAMAKSRDLRYSTCAQFAADLGRSLDLLPGRPEPPSPPGRPKTELAAPRPSVAAAYPSAPVAPSERSRLEQEARFYGPGRPYFAQRPANPTPAPQPYQAPQPGTGGSAPGGHSPGGYPPGGHASGGYTPGGHAPGGYAPGGYRAGGSGWPSQPPAQSGRRRSRGKVIAAILAAILIVAAAAGGGVFLARQHHGNGSAPPTTPATSAPASPSRSGRPSPSASGSAAARQQASAVSSLLATGAGRSQALSSATTAVQNCENLAGDVAQIRRVRDQRQREFRRAQALTMTALPNGPQMQADLTQALSASLDADSDYLVWAQSQQADCVLGSVSQTALAADTLAVTFKNNFLRLWNPVARQYGYAPASQGSI